MRYKVVNTFDNPAPGLDLFPVKCLKGAFKGQHYRMTIETVGRKF